MNRLSGNFLLTVTSKSFKAVLLHNGKKYPSVPLDYSIQIKEGYENVKKLLLKTNYAEFNWYFCDDFKMLGILLGLHGGYTNTRVFFGCGTAELMESTTRRSIGLQGKN